MIKIIFNFQKLFSFLILMSFSGQTFAGNVPEKTKTEIKLSKTSAYSDFDFLDVNNIRAYFENTGNIQDPSKTWSIEFPKGSGKYPLFAAGFAFSGYIDGELSTAWMSAASRKEEWQPGNIENGVPANSNNSDFRVYKYTKGDNSNTNPDVAAWPVKYGAEYIDANKDGIYDPKDGDEPKLYGDQMVWYVINDAVLPSSSSRLTGGKPMGIEAQVTAFAFAQKNELGNAFFVIYKFINKGPKVLERAIFSIVSDPDLGNPKDDLVGVDSIRSLAYVYNETNNDDTYGSAPPAAGYDFFLGPKEFTGDPKDTTMILGKPYVGYKQLVMKSFVKFINGRVDLPDPNTIDEARYYQEGVKFDGTPFDPLKEGVGGLATDNKIIVHPGSPENRTGWRDSKGDDRREMINTKPFNIEPGDTQIIVVGHMVAQGSDNLNSLTKLREVDDFAQKVFNANFKIAGPPPAPPLGNSGNIVGTQARIDNNGNINLTFPTHESFIDIQTDDLGNKKVFKGYKIYQYKSGEFSEIVDGIANKKLLLQIDRSDGYNLIYQRSADSLTQTLVYESKTKFENETDFADTNSYFNYTIDKDAFTGFNFVPGETYYFGISSYNVEVNKIEPIIKAGKIVGYVHPDSPIAESVDTKVIFTYKNSVKEDYIIAADETSKYVDHKSGSGNGGVFVDLIDPTKVKNGEVYTIDFFYKDKSTLLWRLKDSKGFTHFNDMNSFTKNMVHPLVDGLSIRIGTPIPEVKATSFNGTKKWFKEVPYRTKTGFSVTIKDAVPNFGGLLNDVPNSVPVQYTRTVSNAKPFDVHEISIEFTRQNPSKAYRFISGAAHTAKAFAPPPIIPFSKINKGPADSIIWAGFTKVGPDAPATGRMKATRRPGTGIVDLPFRVWDESYLGQNGEKRQLKVALVETYFNSTQADTFLNAKWDGKKNAREMILISSEYYDPNLSMPADSNSIDRYMNYLVKNDSLIGNFTYAWEVIGDTLDWEEGKIYKVSPSAFTSSDKFTISGFRTDDAYYEENKTSSFANLTIYPNPYMGDNSQEISANSRFVSMLNVPKKVTIRIYNLAGELVRKIEKDDNTSLGTWDLKNHTGLYVASGIYLIHFDAPGVGSKVLKFALIQRQEQISVY